MSRLLQQILGGPHASDHLLEGARPEVFSGIENCYAVLIDSNEAGSLSTLERTAVALQVAALHKNAPLTTWFAEVLEEQGVSPDTVRICMSATAATSNQLGARLSAFLQYAEQQAVQPAAVHRLTVVEAAEQFTPQEIVCLSELVAFVAYLARVIAGLQLVREMEGHP